MDTALCSEFSRRLDKNLLLGLNARYYGRIGQIVILIMPKNNSCQFDLLCVNDLYIEKKRNP